MKKKIIYLTLSIAFMYAFFYFADWVVEYEKSFGEQFWMKPTAIVLFFAWITPTALFINEILKKDEN